MHGPQNVKFDNELLYSRSNTELAIVQHVLTKKNFTLLLECIDFSQDS